MGTPLNQAIMPAGLVNPIFLQRRRYIFRCILCLLHPIPHSHRMGRISQHIQVIGAVPEGIRIPMGNSQDIAYFLDPCCFAKAFGHHFHKIAVPVDHRVLPFQPLLQLLLPARIFQAIYAEFADLQAGFAARNTDHIFPQYL